MLRHECKIHEGEFLEFYCLDASCKDESPFCTNPGHMSTHIHEGRLRLASHRTLFNILSQQEGLTPEQLEPHIATIQKYFRDLRASTNAFIDRAFQSTLRTVRGLAENVSRMSEGAEQAMTSIKLNQMSNSKGVGGFLRQKSTYMGKQKRLQQIAALTNSLTSQFNQQSLHLKLSKLSEFGQITIEKQAEQIKLEADVQREMKFQITKTGEMVGLSLLRISDHSKPIFNVKLILLDSAKKVLQQKTFKVKKQKQKIHFQIKNHIKVKEGDVYFLSVKPDCSLKGFIAQQPTQIVRLEGPFLIAALQIK